MIPYEIIAKKRDGRELSKDELTFFVKGYVNDEIPDYQMAAFLMAVYFRGMTDEETAVLTQVMIDSGDVVDLSEIEGVKVDKHSTGGVGDTTTLILAPLVAAAGVPVAKMSGRGLGHTGGTLDKLESIPGFNIHLSAEQFIKQVREVGISVIGQTNDLVPADRKMYSLRDVTATVNSIPLIATSIMSKKLAAGTDAIVLDVKVGNGAFMKNMEDARRLAKIMVSIGNMMNRKTVALLTDMNEPLGSHIGNSLEVKEAIEILQGMHKGSALYKVSLALGSHMLVLGNASKSAEEGQDKIAKILESGRGLEKLKDMIKAQGGNPKVAEDTSLLPRAEYIMEVRSDKSGYISTFDTVGIGRASLILGAGRLKKTDPIDPSVGLILEKRIGNRITEDETLAYVHANCKGKAEEASGMIRDAIGISHTEVAPPQLILDTVI